MTEETLFHLTLEQPPAERSAFLEKMCGGDHALRQRVEALLHAAAQPGDFLQQPPVQLESTVAAKSPAEGPGSRIGAYKLLQQIGEGGMGTVFMAEQTEPVRRMVALKVIKPGMDSRSILARFEAERQALALMDHPNIAKVFDGGTTDSGHPYFVMELVKGISITKYCDEHRLTPKQRLELFVPICRAVQHAHQKGIIHRDIKPSNVLIALYDGQPVPKVIDFGVAKATGGRLTEKTLFTDFGAVVGTLEYMSPEQAELNQLDIDTRADIYALGVLLYELLTGTTPLERKRLREKAILELLRLIREEEPPKPSTRLSTSEESPSIAAKRGMEPKKLSGLVRGDLDWIVMKCLEKDRNRRYETANGLALDVQRYLADEPVLASPPSAAYRLRKFMRRHKTRLWTAATLLLVLLSAAGGVGWALWDAAAQRETRRTEAAKQEAARRTELAERLADTKRAVSVALAKAQQLREQAAQMPSATSLDTKAALEICGQAEAALAQADTAMDTGSADDELRRQVADMRRQIVQARRQIEHRQAVALRKERLRRDLDDARMAPLYLAQGQGNFFNYASGAEKYAAAFAAYGLEIKSSQTAELVRRIRAEEAALRDALIVALDDWSHDAVGAKQEQLANELRALAAAVDEDAWRQKHRAAAANKDAAALRSLSAEARRLKLPASSLELLAVSLDSHGERPEALSLLRWARARHPSDFWLALTLGNILYWKLGALTPLEIEEMVGCYRTALALRPDAAIIYKSLGSALWFKKDYVEAVAAHQHALTLDPKLPRAHYDLGLSLKGNNQLDEAIVAFHQALDSDSKDVDARTALANTLALQHRLDEAVAEYRKVIAINPTYALAYANLGEILDQQQKLDEAEKMFRKAVEVDPQSAGGHMSLGAHLLSTNRLDEAIVELQKAVELYRTSAQAHFNLSIALRIKGRYAEAKSSMQRALDLLPPNAPLRLSAVQQLKLCDQMLALEGRLPDIVTGKAQPKDNRERGQFIAVCQAQRRYAGATRLYADAFATEPKLADDLTAAHRYNAACDAALAASGQGADADKLDDKERTRLRKQALDWLRADLDLWNKLWDGGKPADRQLLHKMLPHWQDDSDLAGMRDPEALKKLPAEEQEAWRKLWADVAELLKKAGDAK